MDRIGVIGVSWKDGGPQALAECTVAPERRAEFLRDLVREAELSEAFYLATCNRVEIAFAGCGETTLEEFCARIVSRLRGRPFTIAEAMRSVRAWAGEGAAEHLFLVTCGLDSARLGETDIAGQVRGAYELARQAGTIGNRLRRVLDEALKIASEVHQRTALGRERVSLADIAIEQARRRLCEQPGDVVLVGVSPMTRRCGEALAFGGARVHVVNRSLETAAEFAEKVRGEALSLEDFRAEPRSCSVLVSATSAPGPVLSREVLLRLREASGHRVLLLDMAVPGDIDPADAAAAGHEHLPIEEILRIADSGRDRQVEEIAEARVLVDDALVKLRRRMTEKFMAPVVAAVQRRYRDTAIHGVDALLRRELRGLDDRTKEAVRTWAETMARRFAHLPSEGLKGVAFEIGPRGVHAFLARADPDLAVSWDEGTVTARGEEP
jgi:glutamyl-tRNA reductase